MSIEINDTDSKAYIVLGAPHSATSFITKAIKDQGVTVRSNYGKGNYYQYSGVVRMNNRILKEAGGWWNDPPSDEEIEKVDLKKQIKKLVNRLRDKMWAIKDPRMCFTVDHYLEHMDEDVYLICCFRKPERIVESYKRMGREKEVTRELVDRHNRSLLKSVRKFCGI
jgi:hypothetical protein